MPETGNRNPERPYDLEQRTELFAREVRAFIKALRPTLANMEDARQLVRASGSVGANYIEANEALGRKDFLLKVKTCRKEAKESAYWLRLVDTEGEGERDRQRKALEQEAKELTNIFGAILRKSE